MEVDVKTFPDSVACHWSNLNQIANRVLQKLINVRQEHHQIKLGREETECCLFFQRTWDLVQVHYRSEFSIKQMFILIHKSYFSSEIHHLEQNHSKVIMPPYCLDILIYFLLF